MSSMITNQFRLLLLLKWSWHWYYPFPAFTALNQVFCKSNLVIKKRQFVRMLHVKNEVTIDTCDIHQIKENVEVKCKASLLIHSFPSSKLIISHSLFQRQMIKSVLTNYLSICKPLYYLKKGTRNLPFSSAYCRSFLTFAFCWLKLFQYYKCLFGIVFQLTLHY